MDRSEYSSAVTAGAVALVAVAVAFTLDVSEPLLRFLGELFRVVALLVTIGVVGGMLYLTRVLWFNRGGLGKDG